MDIGLPAQHLAVQIARAADDPQALQRTGEVHQEQVPVHVDVGTGAQIEGDLLRVGRQIELEPAERHEAQHVVDPHDAERGRRGHRLAAEHAAVVAERDDGGDGRHDRKAGSEAHALAEHHAERDDAEVRARKRPADADVVAVDKGEPEVAQDDRRQNGGDVVPEVRRAEGEHYRHQRAEARGEVAPGARLVEQDGGRAHEIGREAREGRQQVRDALRAPLAVQIHGRLREERVRDDVGVDVDEIEQHKRKDVADVPQHALVADGGALEERQNVPELQIGALAEVHNVARLAELRAGHAEDEPEDHVERRGDQRGSERDEECEVGEPKLRAQQHEARGERNAEEREAGRAGQIAQIVADGVSENADADRRHHAEDREERQILEVVAEPVEVRNEGQHREDERGNAHAQQHVRVEVRGADRALVGLQRAVAGSGDLAGDERRLEHDARRNARPDAAAEGVDDLREVRGEQEDR